LEKTTEQLIHHRLLLGPVVPPTTPSHFR